MGLESTGTDRKLEWRDQLRPSTMHAMTSDATNRSWRVPDNTPELRRQAIDVWRMHIAPDQFSVWQSRVTTLSQEEQARAERFRFENDRIAFLSAHIQLRDVLSRYVGVMPAALAFTRNETGKPALQDSSLQFNLSHAGDWALCAVCTTEPVGVDIERIRPMPDRDDVAMQVFTARERATLRGSDDECDIAFFRLWTAKEAYIKGIGVGLGMDLQRFSVSETGDIDDSARPTPAWRVHRLNPADGYAGALATPLAGMRLALFAR
jgi:4'-phosphopantetheinyl transferase